MPEQLISNDPSLWRDVFRYAVQPEVFLDAHNLRSLLATAGLADDGAMPRAVSEVDVDHDLQALRAQADRIEGAWDEVFASVRSDEIASEIERMIVAQSAPMAAALGVWLQGLSAPAVFEDEAHLKLLALLADDVGVGRAENARHDVYRLLARRMGLTEAIAATRDLVSVRSIRDAMFCWPGVVFAVSRRSDAFAFELVGIDLALRTVGLLPAWRAVAKRRTTADLAGLDLAVARTSVLPDAHSPCTLSRWVVDRHAADPAQAARIRDGIGWATRGLMRWSDDLLDHVKVRINPRLAMGLLVQERAREARIYHQNYKLEGKNLGVWFEEALIDPLPLIDVLGRSKLVRVQSPERSALITSLIRANGPMFRIFSDEDIAIIRRWIESLGGSAAQAGIQPEGALPFTVLTARPPVGTGDLTLGATPTSIREAYYLLQGRALAPRTRAFATDYMRKWTAVARESIDKTERSLPAQWYPGALRAWLLDAHDKHGHEFERRKADGFPTRDEIIDQTLQLAPLTLIDGAWLQGFTETALASSRIGAPMFQIYWDELGNGQWELNHPKVYRDVLAKMGIILAPTGSNAFAADPRLRPESFRLPVYWLCVGKCPVTFRPEILGLNLAMELSGVGGSYRSAQKFLKHYGFPTTFVDLHNTIDNVSTGHSAWAADASTPTCRRSRSSAIQRWNGSGCGQVTSRLRRLPTETATSTISAMRPAPSPPLRPN
jgi:hypothetical protein